MNITPQVRVQYTPHGMTSARQFINWRTVPLGGGKTDKIPCDAAGNTVNSQDPAVWRSWDEARQAAFLVGFVLTKADDWFFIDLDEAYDMARGEWTQLACDVMAMFPGAYREVSHSGRGLHIVARGARAIPADHATRRKGLLMEVYTHGRFVGLTGHMAQGDASIDYGPQLLTLMHRYQLPLERPAGGVFDEGRDERWSGPEDDDELIALALTMRPTTAQMFGDKPTFRELWQLDEDALSRKMGMAGRADGKQYDHSEVDASLMGNLSYFTGRDMPRMVRLFQRWAGYRPEKYEGRGAYRMTRLVGIGAGNPNVLSRRPAEATVGAVEAMDNFLAYRPGNTFYHIPTGAFWPVATIDSVLFPVEVGKAFGSGLDKTIKASKWLMQQRGVDGRTWYPGADLVIEDMVCGEGRFVPHKGMRLLNTYRAPSAPVASGRGVDPWLAHIRTIYPGHAEYMLDWMAFVAQNQGVKVNHALVLGGGQGIGKDAIIEPLRRAVGEWNWKDISPETLVKSDFNPWLKCRVLLISEAKDMGGESKYALYEKSKTVIVSPPMMHTINEKGDKPYAVPNLNATIITTNHRTGALYLPADDRRHYVMFSDTPREAFGSQYWTDYWSWLQGGAIEDCAAYLMTRDVGRFNPKAEPPKTPEFWDMVEGGQPQENNDLTDLLDTIGGGPFTLSQIAMAATLHGYKGLADMLIDTSKGTRVRKMLNEAGMVQFRNPDEKRGRFLEGNKQVRKYIRL